MSEHGVKPESQSIKGCAALREACQEKIFKKLDDHHETQMRAIGKIGTKIAYMEGAASASKPSTIKIKNDENGKERIEFKQFLMQAAIAWGPWIAMIFGLGLIAFLKSKGIL